MALCVAGLGIWYAFGKERRRAGLAIMSFGILWSCLALLVVVPAFSGGDSVYYGAYDAIGGSPTGIVRNSAHASDDHPLPADRVSGSALPRIACCAARGRVSARSGSRSRCASSAAGEPCSPDLAERRILTPTTSPESSRSCSRPSQSDSDGSRSDGGSGRRARPDAHGGGECGRAVARRACAEAQLDGWRRGA